ncbi:endonuclease MutS2, partial [candidate division KSB1 bacterium]|nr:endonuclease MutS2 [candidate division KSB1 bacterium]
MNQYIFETLEFDRIITHLASHADSPLSKERINSLRPLSNINDLDKKLSEVTELRAIIDFDDPFPVHGIRDIRAALKKASLAGNYLTTEELSAVGDTLNVFRRLRQYFNSRDDKYPLLQ